METTWRWRGLPGFLEGSSDQRCSALPLRLPIADQRLEGGKRRKRRGIGAQHARSQTDGANKRKFLQGVKLRLGEAALGSGEHRPGTGGRIAQRLGNGR